MEDDNEELAEAELRREREEALRCAQADIGSLAGGLVLKVQCRHGSVQIRQGKTDNFKALLQKFVAYAETKGWANKGQKLTLQFDGDVIADTSTPEELAMEDAEAIDVAIV
jgi:hypothetical protein